MGCPYVSLMKKKKDKNIKMGCMKNNEKYENCQTLDFNSILFHFRPFEHFNLKVMNELETFIIEVIKFYT